MFAVETTISICMHMYVVCYIQSSLKSSDFGNWKRCERPNFAKKHGVQNGTAAAVEGTVGVSG